MAANASWPAAGQDGCRDGGGGGGGGGGQYGGGKHGPTARPADTHYIANYPNFSDSGGSG